MNTNVEMSTQILPYFIYFDASLHAILDSLHQHKSIIDISGNGFRIEMQHAMRKCAKLVIEIDLAYKYRIIVHSIDCNTPVVLILCSTLGN